MNKENSFFENELSTDYHDSCSKTTYSSRYQMMNQHKRPNFQKQVLPSRYQKAAVIIQRFFRFRMSMQRKVHQKIISSSMAQNECLEIENKMLQKAIESMEKDIAIKKQIKNFKVQLLTETAQKQLSQLKKECVVTNFKLNRMCPSKEKLQEIVIMKQELKEKNLEMQRQLLIAEDTINELRKEEQMNMKQLKQLKQTHLEAVKIKNSLKQYNSLKMLETSKFGVGESHEFEEK